MNVILANASAPNIIDAVAGTPWYVHLVAAGGLGLAVYGVHKFADRRGIKSELLMITTLFAAIGAFVLAVTGIFGNN